MTQKGNEMNTRHIVVVMAKPVRFLVATIHRETHKHKVITEISIGCSIAIFGVAVAQYHQHVVPHIIQDGVGYTIHGIGVAPIVDRVMGAVRTMLSIEE